SSAGVSGSVGSVAGAEGTGSCASAWNAARSSASPGCLHPPSARAAAASSAAPMVVFAGTHTATEINAGSTALSFLTQKSRWASLVAQAAVQWAFLAFAYVVGIGLALVAARFYPDGLAMSPRGWAYLAA